MNPASFVKKINVFLITHIYFIGLRENTAWFHNIIMSSVLKIFTKKRLCLFCSHLVLHDYTLFETSGGLLTNCQWFQCEHKTTTTANTTSTPPSASPSTKTTTKTAEVEDGYKNLNLDHTL